MKELDKRFDYLKEEKKIYENWEQKGYFKPEINKNGEPFTIILPPPNANGDLHLGHAMYTVEDILIRYNRMLGKATLWLPGADHAGFETQFVFEKKLKKEGKSRFDYKREVFYQKVLDFVLSNKGNMQKQLRALGFSLDWSRDEFTLDNDIIDTVYDTFISLYQDKLVYKGVRVGNYCTYCGTGFSDLEVEHKEENGKLYYIKYKIADTKNNFVTVATTRPETMLGDTAVAVNPKDKKYKKLIGKYLILPLVNKKILIIADNLVDPKFGTGAVKVTPAHSEVDYEMYLKNKEIGILEVINKYGKINENAPKKYQGIKALIAREEIVKDLEKLDLIEKIVPHKHAVGHCYKCGRVVEALPLPQWFVKIKPLAKEAIKAVKEEKIKFIPKRFEKIYYNWMDNIRDWPISRQLWFGIRMPVWYCEYCDQMMISKTKPEKCSKCGGKTVYQEEDTFDTWFSSGQWPFATLMNSNKGDFEKFYPTTVMETAYDIIFFWVARMIMLGLYKTKKIPFKYVYLHGLVKDKFGQKMSKSKGNIINPIEMIEKYGTDALRFALIMGNTAGGNQSMNEEKIKGFRNFVTKIWNASRFVLMQIDDFDPNKKPKIITKKDEEYLQDFKESMITVTKNIDKFEFNLAAERLHNYFWHTFCDKIIEDLKNRVYKPVSVEDKYSAQFTLYTILKNSLIMLHPFTPFVTEAIWQNIPKQKNNKVSIMIQSWPSEKDIQ